MKSNVDGWSQDADNTFDSIVEFWKYFNFYVNIESIIFFIFYNC